MNLTKLEDLNIVPSEEDRRKLGKKNGKMIFDNAISEIGEKFDTYE